MCSETKAILQFRISRKSRFRFSGRSVDFFSKNGEKFQVEYINDNVIPGITNQMLFNLD